MGLLAFDLAHLRRYLWLGRDIELGDFWRIVFSLSQSSIWAPASSYPRSPPRYRPLATLLESPPTLPYLPRPRLPPARLSHPTNASYLRTPHAHGPDSTQDPTAREIRAGPQDRKDGYTIHRRREGGRASPRPLPLTLSLTHDPEQRFVLAELIKASKADMGPLVEFVKANCLSYSWFSVQVPAGMSAPPP